MRFMQIELILQTKNQSEPAKNWFSVALIASDCLLSVNYRCPKSQRQSFEKSE